MSQRYVPPPNDGRFQRDRSPPRNSPASASGPGPEYSSRPDSQYSNPNKDVPRGPKAAVDTARPQQPPPPAASRGYGHSTRNEYRADFRDQSGGRPIDRDKWNDRDTDRRDRRTSPTRPRASPTDFRDSRDSAPRESEPTRDRRGSRDGPITPSSYYPDSRGRGGYARGGRDRDDWDSRSRPGRSNYLEPRGGDSFRPGTSRSRSPPTYRRWDREDRDYDRGDNRWPDRREEDRNAEREEREREAERYKKEKALQSTDSRRPSVTPTPSSNPARAIQAQGGNRSATDQEKGQIPQPRLSSGPPFGHRSGSRENVRSESSTARNDNSKDPAGSGTLTSSPPRAPEVPAYGSISYKSQPSELPWNVWRAPTEQKLTPTGPKSTVPLVNAPPIPTAPKADVDRMPPTAPKADRVAEQIGMRRDTGLASSIDQKASEVSSHRPPTPTGSFVDTLNKPSDTAIQKNHTSAKSPPLGPRQLTVVPQGPRHAQQPVPAQRSGQAGSPPGSPGFAAPSGPRALASHPPVNALGSSVPTGPKGNRGHAMPPNRPPYAASGQASWQWNRFNQPVPPPPAAPATVPAKRDFDGQERFKHVPEEPTTRSAGYPSPTEDKDLSKGFSNEELNAERIPGKHPLLITSGDALERNTDDAPRQNRRQVAADEEDAMDLDENDFEGNEARYERDRNLLEAKFFDLSAPRLRGSVPLRNLAMLARISLLDIPFTSDRLLTTKAINGVQSSEREDFLTPKFEDEDVSMIDEKSSPTRSPSLVSLSPIGTPELQSLPYLRSDTPLSLPDVEALQETLVKHDTLKNSIHTEIERQAETHSIQDEELRDEFATLYKPWRMYCARLDKERESKEKQEAASLEMANFEPVPEVSPSVQTPSEGRRRGGLDRFASEFDLEQVMKESAKTHQLETQKREKEAELSKPNMNKEAVIPDMLRPGEIDGTYFQDTTMARHPDDAIEIYELQPPADDFTEEEHRILVQNFKEYPKKWGKLASALPDRTYKACINHYYATKWNKEYKPPKDKRRRNGVVPRGPRMRNMQGKPKANALISNLGGIQPDVYDGAEVDGPMIAMTERGRPKRAAAPIFGDKEMEDQSGTASTTPARKGAVDNGNEKSASKPRGSGTKEKAPRKPQQRGRQPIRTQGSMSPEKSALELNHDRLHIRADLDAFPPRDLETANALAQLGQTSGQHPLSLSEPSMPMTFNSGSPMIAHQQPQVPVQQQSSQPQRSGNSSYWSVDEKNIFPQLLEHYGTDWQSIAKTMNTKTHTMVKNFYYRVITSESDAKYEYEEKARRGNDKRERGEAPGPPPPLPPQASTNTRRRPDPAPPMVPRPLAPSKEANEVEEDATTYPPQPMRHISPFQTTQPVTTNHSSQGFIPERQAESPRRRPLSSTNAHINTSRSAEVGMHSSAPSYGVSRSQDSTSILSRESYPSRSMLPTGALGQSSQQSPLFSSEHRRELLSDPAQISVHSHYSRHEAAQRPSDGYPPRPEFAAYRQSPQQRYINPTFGAAHTSVSDKKPESGQHFSSSRVTEPNSAQSSIHSLVNSPFSKTSAPQGPSMPFLEPVRTRPLSPRRESPRAILNPTFPPQQSSLQPPPQPPPRSDPPKTSSIAALLNADDEPRHQRSTSGHSQRTKNYTPPNMEHRYPPPSMPPASRPSPQPSRRELFLDRSTTQPSPFESKAAEALPKFSHWYKPSSRPDEYPMTSTSLPPQYRTGAYRDYDTSASYHRENEAQHPAYVPSFRRDEPLHNTAAMSHNSNASVDWSTRANILSSIPPRSSTHNSPRERYGQPSGAWEGGSSALRGVGGSFEREQRDRNEGSLPHDRHARYPEAIPRTSGPSSSYDAYQSSDPFAYRGSLSSMSSLKRPPSPPRQTPSSTAPPQPSSTPGGTEMVFERRVTGMFSPPPGYPPHVPHHQHHHQAPPPPPPPRQYEQDRSQPYSQHHPSQASGVQRSLSRDR